MSLWGMKDSKTVASTTIQIDTAGAVTGVDTTFESQLAVGDYILVAGAHFRVTAIASDTAATVVSADKADPIVAVSATGTFVVSEKPIYVDAASNESVAEIYGADAGEVGETAGITHAGWVKRTVGTGGRAGRVQFETLVAAGSITGDAADDSILPDPVPE
jgi:hypothetical protein